jgi:hypothetical protein
MAAGGGQQIHLLTTANGQILATNLGTLPGLQTLGGGLSNNGESSVVRTFMALASRVAWGKCSPSDITKKQSLLQNGKKTVQKASCVPDAGLLVCHKEAIEFVLCLTSSDFFCHTVNHEIFTALKVGEFAFLQLAVDKIPQLLQKFNG